MIITLSRTTECLVGSVTALSDKVALLIFMHTLESPTSEGVLSRTESRQGATREGDVIYRDVSSYTSPSHT